ncbi:8b286668-35fc-4987-9deb-17832c2848eb [Thermothielavioides terrestris]|uniref:8b286668-35fc-4987-9deb-17832c2848eb n=1 Tax=Thermothielavioides terrestris TaxID=2587410 RepID=A0A446BFY9_9PEZI|nr:8b286668-35fc-4987-9deb-17832c2848eb [Thermothielavioides terrestris]
MKRGRHYLHLLILLAAAAAGPVQAFNLRTWLDNPPYAGGGTAQEQIQCYALPYGAIGFSSHLLTYLTAFLLSIGRHPLLFWNRLKRRRFNIFVSAVGFCVSCPVTVLTMVRCRRTWPFILLAIWKLFLSATITIMAIHAASLIPSTPPEPPNSPAATPTSSPPDEYESGRRMDNPTVPSSSYASKSSRRYEEEAYPHTSRTANNTIYELRRPASAPASPDGAADSYYSSRRHYRERSYQYTSRTATETSYELRDSATDDAADSDGRPAPAERDANREAPARRYPPSWSEQFQRIWWWVLLYFVGTVVGFVGLMDIVKNNMGTAGRLRAVTGAFGGITLFLVLLFVIGSMFEERDTNRRLNKEQGEPPRDRRGQIAELLSNFSIVMFLSFSVAMVAILFAFYTDWALAAVAGDLL